VVEGGGGHGGSFCVGVRSLSLGAAADEMREALGEHRARPGAEAPRAPSALCQNRRMAESSSEPRWKHDGVRVIPADRLDPNTAQTPGMDR
jgi:hypothetical protein